MWKTQFFLVLFLLLSYVGIGQSLEPVLVSSAGGHFDAGSASLSWSLGEPVIATEDAGSQVLTQGFHQTFLNISSVSSIGEASSIGVFPNPNAGLLTVDLSDLDVACRVEVYDALGRLLIQANANPNQQLDLDLYDFSAGHYFLRVYNAQSILEVFKIQKL
jgi:hypothetical protein